MNSYICVLVNSTATQRFSLAQTMWSALPSRGLLTQTAIDRSHQHVAELAQNLSCIHSEIGLT